MLYFNYSNKWLRKGKLREIGGHKAVRPKCWDRQVAESQRFSFNPRQGFAWDFFYVYPKVPGINKKVPGIKQKPAGTERAVRDNGVKYAQAAKDIFRKSIILCYLQGRAGSAHLQGPGGLPGIYGGVKKI